MKKSPLAAGFCRGLAASLDTPPMDRTSQLSTMKLQAIAEKYNVHPRTVRRWRSSGVDVQDFRAVARHLAEQRRPSIHAIRASLQILNSNP